MGVEWCAQNLGWVFLAGDSLPIPSPSSLSPTVSPDPWAHLRHLSSPFLQVRDVYKTYIFSLFLGYLIQFENSALLVSPLFSLVVALMLAKCLQVRRAHFWGSN